MTTNISSDIATFLETFKTFVDNFDMMVVSKHILNDMSSPTRTYVCKIRLQYKPTDRSLVCSYQHTVHPFQMDREIQKEKVIATLAYNALCKLKRRYKGVTSKCHRQQVERSNDAGRLRYALGADQFACFMVGFEALLNS